MLAFMIQFKLLLELHMLLDSRFIHLIVEKVFVFSFLTFKRLLNFWKGIPSRNQQTHLKLWNIMCGLFYMYMYIYI